MLDYGSLRRRSSFPFAIYPRLPRLVNGSRLARLCVSLQNRDMVTLQEPMEDLRGSR